MFSHFFADRPVFASVLSIVIVIVGLVALAGLPVGQYPEIAPPTISIQAVYPGASAQVVADTVTTPIEQEVNGVENMLYIASKSSGDGVATIEVTFTLGTDIDQAQVLTQNRVAIAEAKLPDEVLRQGVTVKKKSPSILLCVNLTSPDGRYDQLYLSNYATLQVKDALARIPGVGDVSFLGGRDYAMRVWLDPDKLAARRLSAGDVVRALREQNAQVAAGRLGSEPTTGRIDFQLPINTTGRLPTAEEFADVIVKVGDAGGSPLAQPERAVGPARSAGVVRLRDIGRVELGAKDEEMGSRLDGDPSITIAVFQLPGSNALETAEAIHKEMATLARDFPEGLDYAIHYDTTVFVEESVQEVVKTLFEAVVLVFLVVLIFLQDWRATLIPMLAVPVSLIGTLAVMAGLGFTLNNLSLFGLVLAIGVVVDDAIVVVENVERCLAEGLSSREATRKTMTEVSGALIATSLALVSVFVPTAFIAGISGEFYKQFALTIAASTVISTFNSLTLSPAMAVVLFRGHEAESAGHTQAAAAKKALPAAGVALLGGLLATWLFEDQVLVAVGQLLPGGLPTAGVGPSEGWWSLAMLSWCVRLGVFVLGSAAGWLATPLVNRVLAAFFRVFNFFFEITTDAYGKAVGRLVRLAIVVMGVYAGLMGLTYVGFTSVPTGFIPEQDKGYLVVDCTLPEGASLQRTDPVVRQLEAMALETPGVAHVISVTGYSLISSVNQSNAGGMFVLLAPFTERQVDDTKSADAVLRTLRKKFATIRDASVVAFGAPPVDGLGRTGGFKLEVRDRTNQGPLALDAAAEALVEAAAAQPGLAGVFSSFRADQPQLFVDIDRTKVKAQGIDLEEVNRTLQVFLGGAYVNDFTAFGRNWQVKVQAEAPYRMTEEAIERLQVRNAAGTMVPLSTLVSVRDTAGPAIITRYNLYPAADVSGGTLPGTSSGESIAIMEALATPPPLGRGVLPQGMDIEWTELALQQILAGDTATFVFLLGTVFVFLVLAAQYESWSMPLAVILIVPMCLLAAITGVWVAGMANTIFTQIGLVVLVGLSAKNAILIVEFAKQREQAGVPLYEAVLEAATSRLRPILMTALSFILGVVPLLSGRGAGAEMRVSLGTAVFSGMLGVTAFGIFFTPVFYWVVMRLAGRSR